MSQFQTQVNIQPAPGVAGDFCSANPRATVLAGPGALVAGPNGVTVGLFAWATSNNQYDPISGETDAFNIVSNTGLGAPTGFVHRNQQALITVFLSSHSNVIPQGLPVTLHSAGDFWVVNNGASAATAGQKAYANNANGTISFGATGSPPTGATVTGSVVVNEGSSSSIAVNTATGSSISGTTLTIGTVTAGAFFGGGVQSITGAGVAAGTVIVSQLTGTANGAGTYQVNISQTVASTTVTGSGGTLTVGGTVTGYFALGQTISGSGVTSGSTLLANGSGAGGAGTYLVSAAQTVSAEAITASGAYLNVTAVSSGVIGLNDTISGGSITAGTAIIQFLTGTGGIGTYLTTTSAAQTSTTVTVYGATETKWYAMSNGAVGELIKMSSWALG